MDLRTLIRNMLAAGGDVEQLARDPRAQFGTRERRYLGAEILPERPVTENMYREENIRYRTVVANANTRYSPPSLKGGALVGSFLVELAETDIASELTGRDYDILRRVLRRNQSMEATAQLIRFVDVTINQALIDVLEVWRWQAIVDALVQARGDNGYSEDIPYSNPAGHRANATAAWTDPGTDPYDDILAMAQVLRDKGFEISRIFAGTPVISKMLANPNTARRTGRVAVSAAGQIESVFGRPSLAQYNQVLSEDGLPAIERYDLKYNTSTGSQFFLKRDVMVFVATTGQDEEVRIGTDDDAMEVLPNVLGYTGVGTPTGQAQPGRRILMEAFDRKPPRVEAEGWQTALPVITQPEAIAVIKSIS